jgi:hypothetical protein
MSICRALSLCLFLCGFSVPAANGRIGDTVAEIEARYGQPFNAVAPRKNGLDYVTYRPKNYYTVEVLFKDGLSVYELFTFLEDAEVHLDALFSAILLENGGARQFLADQMDGVGDSTYLRKDGKVRARRWDKGMAIYDPDFRLGGLLVPKPSASPPDR